MTPERIGKEGAVMADQRFTAEQLREDAVAYERDDGSEQQFGLPAMLRYAATLTEQVEQMRKWLDTDGWNANPVDTYDKFNQLFPKEG